MLLFSPSVRVLCWVFWILFLSLKIPVWKGISNSEFPRISTIFQVAFHYLNRQALLPNFFWVGGEGGTDLCLIFIALNIKKQSTHKKCGSLKQQNLIGINNGRKVLKVLFQLCNIRNELIHNGWPSFVECFIPDWSAKAGAI